MPDATPPQGAGPPCAFDPRRGVLHPVVCDGAVPVATAVGMADHIDLPVGNTPGLTRRMRILHRFEALESHRDKPARRVKTFATLEDAEAWLRAGRTTAEAKTLSDFGFATHETRPPVPYSAGWVRWVRAAPSYIDASLMDLMEAEMESILGQETSTPSVQSKEA